MIYRSQNSQDAANTETISVRFHKLFNNKQIQITKIDQYLKSKENIRTMIRKHKRRTRVLDEFAANASGFAAFADKIPADYVEYIKYIEVGHDENEMLIMMVCIFCSI